MPDLMYCIEHEKMEMTEKGRCGLVHIVLSFDGMDWCEGPFAACPPPDEPTDTYFDHLFANEDEIWSYLDWVRQMESGNENG